MTTELKPSSTPVPRLAGDPLHVNLGVLLLRLVLTAIAASGIVLQHGFYTLPLPFGLTLLHAIQAVALGLYAADVIVRVWLRRVPMPGAGLAWTDRVLFLLALVGVVTDLFNLAGYGWQLFEIAAAFLFFSELWRMNVALLRLLTRPGLMLPLSFAALIVVGTLLLKTPVAVPQGDSISWLDALFTMTSAVCVTGLVVRDTATEFTWFGQLLIGVFIQLGGLGIIIFGSVMAMLLGRSLSLHEHVSLSEILENQPMRNVTSFVRFIVLTTLGIELLGALAMIPLWHPPSAGWTWERYLGMSIFHSVSAFCNAGFDLTGHSMVPYRYSLLPHLVIAPLIVIGGIGFPVLANLRWAAWGKLRQWWGRPVHVSQLAQHRLSLHTKLALTVTLACYLYGVVFIGVGQLMPYVWEHTGQGQTANVQRPDELSFTKIGHILADASFMSITARTAGFNTVPLAVGQQGSEEMQKSGHFTLMTLMVIGGSPGSTAGGAKTTVVGLLVLSVIATMRNQRETEAFGRTIADALVRRAATIGICFMLLIVVSTLLLCFSESPPFEKLLFEAISAAGTVGLTLGITTGLTSFGKAIIIGTMFLGRVGPLTLLAALVLSRRQRHPYAYAHEDVVLG